MAATRDATIPFLKTKVPVVVDRHPAIDLISQWGPVLKKKIEQACFADYQDKIASIGMNPSLPRIRKPNEVWKHLDIQSIRINAKAQDTVVVYVVPAWDIDEQMEWCIKGTDQLIYVGQFLDYYVDAYRKCRYGNSAFQANKNKRNDRGR